MTNIFLWLSVIWISPLMYFMLANEAKFKKNVAVGVTLPYEGRSDEEVKNRLKKFKKQTAAVCIIIFLAGIPGMFLESINVSISLLCLWCDLCVILPMIPYVLCNRDLKKIKSQRGWGGISGSVITVDTSSVAIGKWLTPWIFLPSVLLCLLPLLWDRTIFPVYIIFAVSDVLFWFCYRYLYRNKAEKVDGNAQLSKVLTQVRKYNWGKMWLLCSYSFSVMSIGTSLFKYSSLAGIIVTVVITFVIIVAAVKIELSARKVQEKLTAESGKAEYIDDDDKWIGGILYYNPNDSQTVINNRIGTNSTVNLATPKGKIVMGLIALMIIVLPFTGVFLSSLGEKEINIEYTSGVVSVSHGSTEYEVKTEDIKDIKLLDKLPSNMVRTMGTGMENLLKGSFSSPETGSLKVCLDPNYPPYILITDNSGKKYLIGARDPGQTEKIYNEIIRDISG